MLLVGLIGMQFQAKITQADSSQTLLHDGQCSHFFRDKEHPLAIGGEVCDHSGDGLGFSRSGRAVQHKGLLMIGHANCLQLTVIH